MAKLATITMENVGGSKNFLKFKEVRKMEVLDGPEVSDSNSVEPALTIGTFYFARSIFGKDEPVKVTVIVEA